MSNIIKKIELILNSEILKFLLVEKNKYYTLLYGILQPINKYFLFYKYLIII